MNLTTAHATMVLAAVGSLTAIGLIVVVWYSLNRPHRHHRDRLAAPARRMLHALAEGKRPELADELAALEAAVWQAVEPTAKALAARTQGPGRSVLETLRERRALADRAMRDLDERAPPRRVAAVQVLGECRRRDAVAPLRRLLADPAADVRAAAALALGRIGDPTTAEPLLASLVGAHPIPSQLVARALVGLGSEAQPFLDTALTSPTGLVRATAVEVVGLIGAITAAAQVARVLREDPSLDVRLRAAAALARMGSLAALSPLIEAAQPGQPPALRTAAVQALGEIGAVSAAPALAMLANDEQETVAHRAVWALMRLGDAGLTALKP